MTPVFIVDLPGGDGGSIDHLMIDKSSGHVGYAIMKFGGF
ncbi:MAG: PRC-barrel domain containing protein, partial [Pseudomonadota bacterium]